MDLKTFSKKLRHAADVLDDLLETTGTPAVARKIAANMDRAVRRAVVRRTKKHWTQTPKGRRQMKKIQKAWRQREANRGHG